MGHLYGVMVFSVLTSLVDFKNMSSVSFVFSFFSFSKWKSLLELRSYMASKGRDDWFRYIRFWRFAMLHENETAAADEGSCAV